MKSLISNLTMDLNITLIGVNIENLKNKTKLRAAVKKLKRKNIIRKKSEA